MSKKWNFEDFDACYRQNVTSFEDGFSHASKQGIPRFIEEYRISRVKDAIAPWISLHSKDGAVGTRHQGIRGGEEEGVIGNRLSVDSGEERNNRDCKKENDFVENDLKSPSQQLTKLQIADHRSLVLDLGCGHGWYPFRLIDKWGFQGHITCVDISQHNISIFQDEIRKRGYGDRLSANVANVENLPFQDNHFDLAYSSEVLEHVRTPQKLFEEAYRVLKPGGEFIITSPSGPMHRFWNVLFWFPKQMGRVVRGRKSEVGREEGISIYDAPLSFKEIKAQYTKAGFELIHYHKAVFLPHESYIRFFPRPLQHLLLFRAKVLEFLGPLMMWMGLHHIIRLKKRLPVDKTGFS